MTTFVEADMNNYKYWTKQSGDIPLVHDYEIARINEDIMETKACYMNHIYESEFINEKTNQWSNPLQRSYIRQHTIELIQKFSEGNKSSRFINTDMILNDANEIISNYTTLADNTMYAIVQKKHISLHSIPFVEDLGINELIDYFNITDLMQNEAILVLCSYNNAFYVYSSYGEGWITINSSCDLLFISKEQWIKSNKNNKPVNYLSENYLLEVAFRHLNQRYFWGSAYDCSGFIRYIFKELGLLIPSNTTRQKAMPCMKYDVSTVSIDDKKKILNSLPVGSVLYMPSHAAMYIGERKGHYYVINSVGSYYDPQTNCLHKPHLVMVNSLDLIRASGETWLESMDMFIVPWIHE